MTSATLRRFPSFGFVATLAVAMPGCILVTSDDDGTMDSLNEETEGFIDDDDETAPSADTDDPVDDTTTGADAETDGGTATSGDETDLVCSTNLMLDPGFEAGSPSDSWQEASELFGSPMCDGACSEDDTAQPSDGDWWIWFGGMEEAETASVAQSVTFAGDAAVLSFALSINAAAGTSDDLFAVRIDKDTVFMVTDGDQADYADYTTVELDVSAYADGQPHTVTFEAEIAGVGLTNFFLDDVSLVECDEPGDTEGSSGSSGDDTGAADESGGSSGSSSTGTAETGSESGSESGSGSDSGA